MKSPTTTSARRTIWLNSIKNERFRRICALAAAASPSYLPLRPTMLYGTGWALFDRTDPSRLIARCDEPFITPEYLYEFYGVADFVCFASGLVEFNGRHILYYGCADMRVAAAVAE